MNLVPSKLALASRKKDIDLAQMYSIMACFECGSCAYICQAQIPIVQLVRTGKAAVRNHPPARACDCGILAAVSLPLIAASLIARPP